MAIECMRLVNVPRGVDVPISIPSGKTWKITAIGVKGDLSVRIAQDDPSSGNRYLSEELIRNDAALAVDVRIDDQYKLIFRNHNIVGKDKWAVISYEEI